MATVAQLYQITEGNEVNPTKLIQWLLNPTFNAGSFNGTFGTLTPSSGTFTSVVITTGGLTILGGGLSVVGSTSFSAIDNTPIGATTPSTGAFTTLKVTGLTGILYANGAGVCTVATNAQLPTMTATVGGAVPTPPNNTTTFLRGDGTFAVPSGSSGTVTSVSVTTANGVSGSVATATTTPAITLTLGAITPTSVNGLTVSTTTGTFTLTNAKTLAVTNSLTLSGTDGKTLTVSNSLAFAGTDGTTQTFQASDTIVGRATTDTLTNKRVTVRVGSTTSSATPTINTDNVDVYKLTAQTATITSFTTNLSGTPTDNQFLIIEITGTGAIAITWGASFEASTVALPTTTVGTAMLAVAFLWNTATSKWRCVAAV